jgi:hypothetical protein
MKETEGAAIGNASEIIERFGGIRPMAKKIDVAVTTIQGWKKRDVIPGARRRQILQAAASHNINLSDIMSEDSEKNSEPENHQGAGAHIPGDLRTAPVKDIDAAAQPGLRSIQESRIPAGLEETLSQLEKRAVRKSMRIDLFILALVICTFCGLLIWLRPWSGSRVEDPRLAAMQQDMERLRGDVDTIKTEQSFLSTVIPEDLDQRIAALQEQARQAEEKVSAALGQAGEVSGDVLGENAGSLEMRLSRLEEHLKNFTHTPEMSSLLNRFQTLAQSMGGQEQLDSAVSELVALMDALGQGQEEPDLGTALQTARTQSTALSQTFGGVAPEDIKAAAMLLAMSQFRHSLGRDNMPFEEDLQLLEKLAAPDNPELVQSLERLAPHARSGVLTPAGLNKEFRAFAGEAVVASLKGENVSLTEKAKARLNDLLRVEKDGELITGTPTQAALSKAEKLLDEGDIPGAIAAVETLEGPAAGASAPWLDKARATLMAGQMKTMLERGIGAMTGGAAGSAQLIQDEETGINVLKRTGPP